MDRLRWRCPAAAAAVLLFVFRVVLQPASAAVPANTTGLTEDVPLLDWSEWDRPSPALAWERTGPTFGKPTMGFVNGSCLPGPCQQRQLRRLVHECALQLKVPGLGCGDGLVADDDYRVPLIESLPSCGFEARTTNGTIEHLAARYSFRFIGDSTTRRLTESFMSIVTGEGSTHPKVQERIDFSTGNLKVVFDWAPFCSGPLSVGEMLATVMAEESAEGQGGGINRRPIIITAFGVHDASYQLQVSQQNVKDWYRDQMPQEIFKRDGFRAAGLAACREATAQLVRAATGVGAAGNNPGADSLLRPEGEEAEEEVRGGDEEKEGRGVGGGRRTQELERRRWEQRQQRRTAVATAMPGDVGNGDAAQNNVSSATNSNGDTTETEVSVSINAAVTGSRSGGSVLPPLVFVLQNNGYFNDPDDFQQIFLDEVHEIQRREIGVGLSKPEVENSTLWGAGKPTDDGDTLGESRIADVDNDDGAGVFLVDDSMSLFRKFFCYRIVPSGHYHEPIKIVEGKVLWDLIALVDRVVSGTAPVTTHGDSRGDANSSGRPGPAWVLAVGSVATAAVVLIVVRYRGRVW